MSFPTIPPGMGWPFVDADTGEFQSTAVKEWLADYINAQMQQSAMTLVNVEGLQRWSVARSNSITAPAVITVVGDSISRGVGSDDTNDGPITSTQEAIYREMGWVAQLRRMLAARMGVPDAEGWVGLRPGWAYDVTVSGAIGSGTTGPYGQFATAGAGGLGIGTGHSVTIEDGAVGPFTEVDVFYWGSASGVSVPAEPLITIDGVAKNATPNGNPTGNMMFTTIDGLDDTTHEIVLTRDASQSTRTAYSWAVVVRRSSTGLVVNRIAQSGADTDDLAGAATSAARARVLTSTAMPGYTDLLIIALGTNDQGNQVPINTYKANLQELIDIQVAGGGCVLLLGEPPRPSPTGTITEQQYRDAMADLATANTHVAFADVRPVFGTAAQGLARGLYPVGGTVHPSALGHWTMADAVTELLMRPGR